MNINFEISIFDIILMVSTILIFILFMLNLVKLKKLRKNYSDFMKRLGNGKDLDEMLNRYIDKVDEIQKENNEIKTYNKHLYELSNESFKKYALVRYNAYKYSGNNLSFALAILNGNNSGIILNGIYGRDNSNIYAKSVVKGNSEYVLSKEEKEALDIAMKK